MQPHSLETFSEKFRQAFTRFQQKISLLILQCPDYFCIGHTLIILHKIIHRLPYLMIVLYHELYFALC